MLVDVPDFILIDNIFELSNVTITSNLVRDFVYTEIVDGKYDRNDVHTYLYMIETMLKPFENTNSLELILKLLNEFPDMNKEFAVLVKSNKGFISKVSTKQYIDFLQHPLKI